MTNADAALAHNAADEGTPEGFHGANARANGAAADFDLARSPSHLLHRAHQIASDWFAEAAEASGLTQRQFAVLAAVGAREGLTQTELVRATGIDRSTLAEMVARMAEKDLLSRRRAPTDARAKAVSLTTAGRQALKHAQSTAQAADAAILQVVPAAKRNDLIEALTALVAVAAPRAKTNGVHPD